MLLLGIFTSNVDCYLLEEGTYTKKASDNQKHSKTCIQRPAKGSHKSGLLQQMVFKCRVCWVVLRRDVVSLPHNPDL